MPGVVRRPASRGRSSAARDLLGAGRTGVDGRGAHGHARAGPAPARQGAAQGAQPPFVRFCNAATPPRWAGVIRTPAVVIVATTAIAAGRPGRRAAHGRVALPDVQGARTSWCLGDPTGHVGHQEIVRIIERASRDSARFPACATSAPTSARRCTGEEINGINFAENWISLEPERGLRKDARRDPADRRPYPGLFREQTTYLNERIDEVLAGSSETIAVRIFGPDLTSCATRPSRCTTRCAGSRASSTSHRAPGRRAAHQRQARPREGGPMASSRATSAGRRQRIVAGEEVADLPSTAKRTT